MAALESLHGELHFGDLSIETTAFRGRRNPRKKRLRVRRSERKRERVLVLQEMNSNKAQTTQTQKVTVRNNIGTSTDAARDFFILNFK